VAWFRFANFKLIQNELDPTLAAAGPGIFALRPSQVWHAKTAARGYCKQMGDSGLMPGRPMGLKAEPTHEIAWFVFWVFVAWVITGLVAGLVIYLIR
jgi:hypothetical protein